jgi:phage tail-like protein
MPSDTTGLITHDAVTSSRFALVIDGVPIGTFLEVSGLEVRIETQDYQEGGQNGFVHKFPGRMSWPNLVFKRGITDSDALFDWVNKSSGEQFAANHDKLTRTTGSVSVIDWDGKPLRTWSLIDPFPVRWTGPRFSAKDTSVLEEEVEVAHHGFRAKTTWS